MQTVGQHVCECVRMHACMYTLFVPSIILEASNLGGDGVFLSLTLYSYNEKGVACQKCVCGKEGSFQGSPTTKLSFGFT